MPIIIDEMEVISEPPPSVEQGSPAPRETPPPYPPDPHDIWLVVQHEMERLLRLYAC